MPDTAPVVDLGGDIFNRFQIGAFFWLYIFDLKKQANILQSQTLINL